MSSALSPTCPLCGLRYTDRSLLDLHVHEDHRQQGGRAEPAQRDSGDARAPQPRAGGQSRPPGVFAGPPATTNRSLHDHDDDRDAHHLYEPAGR
jgi:hypothetical protein